MTISHLAAKSQISQRSTLASLFKVNLRNPEKAVVLSVKILSHCFLTWVPRSEKLRELSLICVY